MTTHTDNRESTRGQIGQGVYSLAELSTYLRFYAGAKTGALTLRWLSEALNPVAHERRQPDYSFSDLVSLFVVRGLREHNVRLSRIKEAEATMRQRLSQDRPFLWRDIFTDGEEVFFKTEHGQIESANRSSKRRDGQQIGYVAIERYMRNLRYHDRFAVAWHPVDYVELNPKIQFGEPVVEGTRVPTSSASGRRSPTRRSSASSRWRPPSAACVSRDASSTWSRTSSSTSSGPGV